MSTVGNLVAHFENLFLSKNSEKVKWDTKEKSSSMPAYSGSKVKRFVTDLTEIKRPVNKNKGIDGNASNKSRTLPRCSKDLDLTKEINKDCNGALRKTLSNKKKKSASWKMAKTHSDSIQKDLDIEKKVEEFGNKLRIKRTNSKTVETSFLDNKDIISLNKEEQIKQKLNDEINQQEETVLNLVDTITSIRDTEENNEMVYQKSHESYKDDMPIETEVTEQKEIRIDHVGCYDDIFGCNEFDEDQDDNYVIEARNRIGHELTILTIEIIRYTKKENETEEGIRSLIQKSDYVLRKEETCSLDQTKSELKSQHSSSDESLHKYEPNFQKGESELEGPNASSEESLDKYENNFQEKEGELEDPDASSEESLHKYENNFQKEEGKLKSSEESLHTYVNVPYKETEERVQAPTEFNLLLQYSCSPSSENNCSNSDEYIPPVVEYHNCQYSEECDEEIAEEFENNLNEIDTLRYNCAEKRKQGDNFYRHSESPDTSLEDELDGMLLTTDKPVEKKEKINYVIEEIVKTEELYIHGLERVIEDYIPFVDKETPVNLIGKTVYIFGNIQALYEKAKKFLKLLKQTEQDPNSIAQLFIDNAKMFELYPLYSKNKPTADMYLKEFDDVIKVRQAQLKDKLGLASYLLTPIQRLGKYVLLLEQIKKELKKQEKPLEVIGNAIDVIRNVMRQGNDSIAIDSIKEIKIDLTLYGSFIMRAVFNILKPRKFVSMIFLFENIVVFTEKAYKNPEHFKYVDSIEMSDLSLARFEDKPLVFHLTNYTKSKRIGPEATYVLEAETPKMKYEWTEAIMKKLWTQLENAREQLQKQNSYPTNRHQTKRSQSNITNKGLDRSESKQKQNSCPNEKHQRKPSQSDIRNNSLERSQKSIKRKSTFYYEAPNGDVKN